MELSRMQTLLSMKITFAEHMDRVLYGPEGYYASGKAQSGREGDYFTAPDTGAAFGRLLALTFKAWQAKLGFQPFHLIEAGPGEGALAGRIRESIDFPYTVIERSPFRRAKLKSAGFEVLPDLSALASHPLSGCLFANELLDAFPVHRVRVKNGKLQEAYVEGPGPRPQASDRSGPWALSPEPFRWVWDVPSTPRLAAYFERIGIELPEGYETEVNLAMSKWFVEVSRALHQGLVLLIDYGRPAHAYYAPERDRGTLRSFSAHQVGEDLLSKGDADLTADVDFTSAALDAQAAGLQPLAYMEVGSFLLPAVGALPAGAPPSGLKYLIHPDGMGSAFQVLVLGKGVALTPNDFPNNRLSRLGLNHRHSPRP
jgi:SAM-dependent MidA family methyltransferase